ncbi:ABC transporter family substrate-binding protein [Streptomyces ureilyticus]|uniref:ABC transporter family substrate-binding protein n=1 Tax=Streptomyces ureilyticus TaxID=1775131 RepID=A0ABX0E0Q0_9ACTN|nr:ABC transporter family substrate-binding protein [Streptomyces ureilyticus]NGO45889.1 ABC transporter family substrate-binding protein [Streptomyces ureilyticus]
MSHHGVGPRAAMRSVAFLTAGVLAVPSLAACSEEDPAARPLARQDIAPAERDRIADGGTLRWAMDTVPATLNTFQADADAATSRVVGAVLPSMYRFDERGRPERNPDYLESAEIVEREPQQVVLYKLNQQAVWSDGREIGAADFAAQWRALSGKDTAYWTARNAGYERIEKIERGDSDLEVRVTFRKPYADWRSLFSPLYPKDVMGTPDAFNDGARRKLKVTAGPFRIDEIDRKAGDVRLKRNPRWWGHKPRLSELVLRAVPRNKRAAALAAGRLDLAEIDPSAARRVTAAARAKGSAGAPLAHGPDAELTPGQALRSWAIANGSDEEAADEEITAREQRTEAMAKFREEQAALRRFVVRKSLEPVYTQLALNGAEGPLADERVRRAVARALDRDELARVVLQPLGLPAEPVGSHLALAGQAAYADNSGALGEQDTEEAQALLSDAGWKRGGPVKEKKGEKEKAAKGAGGEASEKPEKSRKSEKPKKPKKPDDGTYIVGQDNKPGAAYDPVSGEASYGEGSGDDSKPAGHGTSAVLVPAPIDQLRTALLDQAAAQAQRREAEKADEEQEAKQESAQEGKAKRGGASGAYAPKGTAAPAPARAAARPLAKDGKPLSLRFVLPSGPGTESLRAVGERIARMLNDIGIRTEISKVSDASYFKDHIASGQYDLALYSWPASAFPATDARPIYAKPVPAADGSLNVEQNYTRVGTDQVDQLFDQAAAELDESKSRSLVRKADARIWAAAGSIPLYQRPQLVAARTNLVNAGAFGFETPVYEDMGYLKKGTKRTS